MSSIRPRAPIEPKTAKTAHITANAAKATAEAAINSAKAAYDA